MRTDLVKGFQDITGENAVKKSEIKRIIENLYKLYGFEPAETPVIEYEDFVKGDNPKDEAISEIYRLKDRKKRKLALRYEFTFQLRRLMQNKKFPYKRYQIGPVFRDEPVSSNRFRQFTQCDADIIGSTIKDEAEILKIISEIMNKLNINYTIYLNNRKLLNEILETLNIKQNQEQIIREIDKLDKLPENQVKQNLKKYNAEKILNIFKKPKKYFEKYNAYQEIKELETLCKQYNVKIIFSPTLARGLSYYNGTIFEVKTTKMKQTILGGGAYKFNNVQCVGFAAGLDRIVSVADIKIKPKKTLIISLGQDKKSIELSAKIRSLNIPCSVYYKKPSKALEYANSYNFRYVIFLGDEEIKKNKFKLKEMNSGKEHLFSEQQLKQFLLKN